MRPSERGFGRSTDGDVAPYYNRAGERFDFSRPEAEPSEAGKVEQAAELLGLDAEALAALLDSV